MTISASSRSSFVLNPVYPESASSSSNLTSSDKLSALPTQSSPVLERLRTPSRVIRRNHDASGSLTSIDSATGSLRALQSLPGPIRQSESADSSGAKDTPRQRNESERSLPATLQNTRQCEYCSYHVSAHSTSSSRYPSAYMRSNMFDLSSFISILVFISLWGWWYIHLQYWPPSA